MLCILTITSIERIGMKHVNRPLQVFVIAIKAGGVSTNHRNTYLNTYTGLGTHSYKINLIILPSLS